jgi:hypothetical protein
MDRIYINILINQFRLKKKQFLVLILYTNFGSLKTKQGNSYLVSIGLDVSLLKIVIKYTLFIIIFLFGSGLA